METTLPDISAALTNIGVIYQDQGKYENALVQYEEALRIDRSIHGNEDLDVAATLTDMVVVYKSETHRECRRRRVQV